MTHQGITVFEVWKDSLKLATIPEQVVPHNRTFDPLRFMLCFQAVKDGEVFRFFGFYGFGSSLNLKDKKMSPTWHEEFLLSSVQFSGSCKSKNFLQHIQSTRGKEVTYKELMVNESVLCYD
jgi:hypothetical protein